MVDIRDDTWVNGTDTCLKVNNQIGSGTMPCGSAYLEHLFVFMLVLASNLHDVRHSL